MLTIVIVTVVLGYVGACIYGIFKPWRRGFYADYSKSIIVILISLILIASVAGGIGVAFFIGSGVPTKYVLREEYKIAALTNKIGGNGDFFLGIGTVDSEPQFFFAYYSEEESGRVEFSSVSPESCKVYEENREDAIVKVMRQENANPAWNLWVLRVPGSLMEFHVPKGTIAHEIDFMGTKQSK